MSDGRYCGRKAIRVPDAGSGEVHVPEAIGPAPGMMVTVADLYAPSGNNATVYVGWRGVSAVKGLEAGIELQPGAIATMCSPKKGEDGNPVEFDLADLFVTGTEDLDAIMYVTW